MVECNLAKVDVEGSNPFSRSAKSLGNSAFAGFPLSFRTRSETRFGHSADSGQGGAFYSGVLPVTPQRSRAFRAAGPTPGSKITALRARARWSGKR